ncbi:MAG: 6-bladed beta-propeller [Gemmatimonadota bacterium]
MFIELALAFALQQPWAVSAQPTVRIGEVEAAEPYMFSQVAAAVRLSDGRIVVANGASNQLRVYDARGRHTTTLGRTGAGPGEFQTLRLLWRLPGDSLIAYDARNGRLTYFDRTPTLLHSVQVPTIPGASGRLADGSLLATIGIAPPEKIKDFQGLIEFNGFVLRKTPSGTSYDTIARGRAGQSFVQPVPPSWRQYPFPYGRTAQIAIGRNRFYYGDTHSTDIGIYDGNGRSIGTVKIRGSGKALSGADIEQWVEKEVEKRTTPQAKTDARAGFKEIPPPRRSPEYAALRLDDAGNLWVRRYGPPWQPSPEWDVYDESGRPLASLRLPARFEPMHIGTDFLLGVTRDDLDVERIELYPLRR